MPSMCDPPVAFGSSSRRTQSRYNRRSFSRKMYPFIADISRTRTLSKKLSPTCYRVPDTKLKNVICVFCKNKFYVPDLTKLNGSISKGTLIPLLLDCGHPVCCKCIRIQKFEKCPSCSIVTRYDSQKPLLPLNLYALGLIVSSYHRPLETNDEDFLFCHKLSTQLRQIAKQGCCHECGNEANVSCPQCVALYCYCCYSKIHGRALQNHTQIPIYDGGPDSPAAIVNSCSPTCSEALSYFCNDCNVACCSNCTLCSHKLHNFIPLSEKNQTLLPEFNETYIQIEETLLRVYETQEKIRSVLRSDTYKLQNSEGLEASIAQHFAYLHGVLQNTEAKLMKQLHEQHDGLKNNLDDIEMQLRSQEEKLKLTLQIASYAKETFHKVDIRNAINILKDMADLPCHLMYKDASQNYKATFIVEDSIVAAIQDHCSVQVPTISSYSLVRRDELPTNYIISPLPKKSRALIFDKPPSVPPLMSPLMSLEIQPCNASSSTSTKMEDKKQESVSECKVEVTYVVNPSLFFVRKVATKPEFLQLGKDLATYGKDQQNVETPINIKQGDMCIVKQWKDNEWYRGHVNMVNAINDGEKSYNVIYIDYGYEECNIAVSRMREIAEQLRTLPPQVIRCSLHGVMPKNTHWTHASANDFLKLASEADCTMSVIKSTPDIQYVDLCVVSKSNNVGPQSMCSIMKVMDYASLDTCQSTVDNARIFPQNTYVYGKEELPLNRTTPVSIGWIESVDKIYVSKAVRQDKISRIMNELNEYYDRETSAKMIDAPQEGLPCAVILPDGNWQRGEITEIINENKVKVFCVDWGCILVQDCDALRAIPYEYTTFKAQAIRISLMYIMCEPDGTWKPEAFATLLGLFNSPSYVTVNPRKRMEDGYMGCLLRDNIDISRQLKAAGVVSDFTMREFKSRAFKKSPLKRALAPPERSGNPVKDLCDSSDDAEDDKSVKDETTKDPFKVEVRIQRVTTPDCIYVAQTEHEKSNTKMMTAMQKFYDTYLSEPHDNWNEGVLCAVYSAKDKSYFRAKILKIQSLTEVLVYFYDMGIEETVTMKDIQVLHPKFAKEATYCFKVKLAGILPCGGSSTWPSLSCATLSEIVRDNMYCKFYITKPVQEDVVTCDDVIPVELWVRQAKIPGPLAPTKIEINSINRMLVDKGVALPVKNYFAKAGSILATEFKLQLESGYRFAPTEEDEEEVKWLNKELNTKEMDDTIISHKSDLSYCDSNIDTLAALNGKYEICDSTSSNRECEVKFSDWLPPTEITEEVFHAITTYVDNKCILYLHSKKYNVDVLHYIETELQTHYKKIKINKEKQWKEGDLCIAQYHRDKKWYRGRVVKNLGNMLQVEFIDYGNVEECEKEYVTDHVRLGHIPIQCTKCIISGLRPASPSGKWMLHDLDRIHALLVDQECKVSILQRQATHLVVSVTLLRPWKCDLLLYLANHMEMNIKIERKEWNDSENSESIDLRSDTTRDVVIEDTISDYEKLCITDTSKKSSSGTYTQNITFNENMISGNLAESIKGELLDQSESKEMSDSESISSIDPIALDKHLICSTPQVLSDEEDCFTSYKRLIIPQETKYIELVLCCNKDPTTSFAQLAENSDDIFSDVFREYHRRFETIMSDLQTVACHQSLIESFAKNTPCVTKFTDEMWYRCIITNSEKIPNTQYMKISLYYVDYGNHDCIKLDLLSKSHDLRIPKEEWLELPAMAIKCTFWGLNFVSNDIDLLATKLNEIYNQSVVARVKEINDGNSLVAEIYKDKKCEELFYAHLIEEGLYQFKKAKED